MTTTFAHTSTGISGLDAILDGLRWGDNVVWQIEDINDYQDIVTPFVEHAIANHIPVVYIHFGQHVPLIPPHPNVKEYQLDARVGFEAFTSRVHAIATKEGEGVFYVFDSLSELLSMWDTDLMIGNFFRVTCPYLFNLNCVSYFALVKYSHSYATIARIREATQLFLNLIRAGEHLYIHPRKVWKRYSPTMFFPHISQDDRFVPITSSAETTQYLNRFECLGPGNVERYLDRWDRVFLTAQEMMEEQNKNTISYKLKENSMVDRLCTLVLGHDERVLSLAREYFSLEDILKIRHRLVGTGFIGGKAVGMLLARKILEKNPETNRANEWEPHDSFYIGSDVFYTYLIENDCWEMFQQQKLPENYYTLAASLRERILNGVMPEIFSGQIRLMLDYYGQSPIIVRSSSLLEDGFGNAFAGKYESVFCVNQGSPEERYENFEKAVKRIFASTMNEDALSYRLQRGMADSDEQMALLVQRVSGSLRDHYFLPDLAGVAMSHNPYIWHEDMDPQAGMVRLVLGLGTRAVDRVDDDYPRIIALDKPSLRPVSNAEDISRFSQRKVDGLDICQNTLSTIDLAAITRQVSELPWWKEVAQPDHHKMNVYREAGRQAPESWILVYEDFLRGDFPRRMRSMLQTLEKAYSYPVDTEFTVNFDNDGHFYINLVQCRPLQIRKASETGFLTFTYDDEKVLFSTQRNSMGGGLQQRLDKVIYIKPDAYLSLSVNDKYETARLVGILNRLFNDRNKQPYMLIGPGRWGSSTPSLGIPISFKEICNASVLVEVALEEGGLMPELSFGTHFFQDLIEAQIFYVALFPAREAVVFDPDKLKELQNEFAHYLPEYEKWQSIIQVYDLSETGRQLWIDADIKNQKTVCFFTDRGDCPSGSED